MTTVQGWMFHTVNYTTELNFADQWTEFVLHFDKIHWVGWLAVLVFA